MKENKIFLETISPFMGENITNINWVAPFETDGPELQKICEEYYKRKLEHSGLRHFYTGKKIEYVAFGLLIGFVLSGLLTIAIFF